MTDTRLYTIACTICQRPAVFKFTESDVLQIRREHVGPGLFRWICSECQDQNTKKYEAYEAFADTPYLRNVTHEYT